MTEVPTDARQMSAEQYKMARAIAAAGKLPPPVRANSKQAPAARTDETEVPVSTSSTDPVPLPKPYGDSGRGVLDLSEEEYREAKARAIADAGVRSFI